MDLHFGGLHYFDALMTGGWSISKAQVGAAARTLMGFGNAAALPRALIKTRLAYAAGLNNPVERIRSPVRGSSIISLEMNLIGKEKQV